MLAWVTGQQPLRERHKTCPDSSPHPPTEQKLWLSEIECAALPVLVKSYCHWDKGTKKSSQLWWKPGICSGPRSTAGVGRTTEKKNHTTETQQHSTCPRLSLHQKSREHPVLHHPRGQQVLRDKGQADNVERDSLWGSIQGEDLKLEEQTLIFKTLWQTMLILNTKIMLEEFKVCGALRATTAIINLKPLSIPD